MKLKLHDIEHPIYPIRYILVIGDNVHQFFQNEYDININNAEGYTYNDGTDIYIYIKNIKNIGHIVHELTHAVQIGLDTIGITTGRNNTEILAYELEYLLHKTLEVYAQ